MKLVNTKKRLKVLLLILLGIKFSVLSQEVIVASLTLSAIKNHKSGEYTLVIHGTDISDHPDAVRFNAGETVKELFYNLTVLDSIIRTTTASEIKIKDCDYTGKVESGSLIQFDVDNTKGEYILTREDIIKMIEQLVLKSYITFDEKDKDGFITVDSLSSRFGWFIINLPKYHLIDVRVFAFWGSDVINKHHGEKLTDQDMKNLLKKSFLLEDRSSTFLKKAIECLIVEDEEFR